MRQLLRLSAGVLAVALLGAGAASAQAVPRNWDRGPVTMIQQVEVKPGQLNAYMQDLATGWRMQMEEGKRTLKGSLLMQGLVFIK